MLFRQDGHFCTPERICGRHGRNSGGNAINHSVGGVKQPQGQGSMGSPVARGHA